MILLGPICWCTFKNIDRSLSRWQDGRKSLAPSSEQTKSVLLLKQGAEAMMFGTSIQNISQTKHENDFEYIIIALHNHFLKVEVLISLLSREKTASGPFLVHLHLQYCSNKMDN